jgi:NH3-dependent NAD+ synthetase
MILKTTLPSGAARDATEEEIQNFIDAVGVERAAELNIERPLPQASLGEDGNRPTRLARPASSESKSRKG